MAGPTQKDRLSPPLMHAFRTAHAARDSKTKLDLRDEEGERVIASRRSAKRGAISEPMLRREVAIDLGALMSGPPDDVVIIMARRRGLAQAVAGVGLHVLHHFTATAALAAGAAAHALDA